MPRLFKGQNFIPLLKVLRTLSLKRVVLFDCDEFCQHAAEPLRVDEVEVIEQTAVLIVQENATVMEEAGGLVNVALLDPLRVG